MKRAHTRRDLPITLLFLASFVGACTAVESGRRVDQRAQEGSVAVAAPESQRLTDDVRWLADDAREGRRAGTRGEREAAEWIAHRLEALGLEPAGTEGFLQPFEVPLPARDGGESSVTYTLVEDDGSTADAVVGDPRRLVPLFCSSAGKAEGRVAFAGYGIVAPELGWDDYGERDVTGAVVVVVRGTPPDGALGVGGAAPEEEAASGEQNPHGAAVGGGSRFGSHGSIFHKVMEAKRRGAVAVLVAVHPDHEDEPLLAFDAGRTARANVPALMIKGSLAEALVPGYGALVAELDAGRAIDHDAVPAQHAGVRADVFRGSGTATNVLARLPGRDAARTVVVGAHFDHLGHGGPGSLAKDAVGEIHNGADDNASGTATVLEIARSLASGPPPEGDVVFALWSGEELGLLGSEHWAREPTLPLEDVRANLNLDMVGRAADGVVQVLGAGTAADLAGWLEEAGPRAGLDLQVSLSGQGVGGSDHQTFLKREIPALHFFTGVHADYHRPSDDADKFEADGARRVAALALDLIARIQDAGELAFVAPAADEQPAPRGGFRTRFGSIPDYAYQGKGLRLSGTSPGGPAERAGLLEGDVLQRIDDVEIEGIGDFMYALNVHKPGDVVLVKYVRDGEELEVHLTLESNQVE